MYLRVVLGYRDLWKAERSFRSMKSVLDLEPVQHRTPERITAPVGRIATDRDRVGVVPHLCVLAQLLTRVAENRVKAGWDLIRERVARITLTELTTDRASVLLTKAEQEIFNCCSAPLPPRILQVATP